VKAWLETRQVLHQLATWQAEGVPCALATVIRVRGSAYRHEGAKLVVAADGRHVGNVSGGCLEADVREVALRVIRSDVAEVREYCGSIDAIQAWDLGVGCEGVVELLIEPVRDARDAERAMMTDARAHVVITDVSTLERRCVSIDEARASGLLGAAESESGDAFESVLRDGRFLEVLSPPPRLLVVSAGDDAVHLARLAASVGFRVVVADRRPGLMTVERFPAPIALVEADAAQLNERVVLDADSFAVVMTHNFADDADYLRALLLTPARYIGVLGPRQRTARMLDGLRSETTVDDSRIFGPVGLDIGTDGAEQVALSVVAEMLAERSGRRPRSLRERRAPIHTDVPVQDRASSVE
jgi:xanthine dehydrogenase accessory factor